MPKTYYVHAFCIFLLIYSFLGESRLPKLIVGSIVIILMELFIFSIRKKLKRIQKERIQLNANGEDKLKIELQFYEDTIQSYIPNINSKSNITYDDIEKLVISDKYSLLFTKNNSFVIIETTKVKENDLAELLVSKNPKIKIRK